MESDEEELEEELEGGDHDAMIIAGVPPAPIPPVIPAPIPVLAPPVTLRTRGRQSNHLEEIRDAMNRGELITHVLNWRVSNEGTNAIGTYIRRFVFASINTIPRAYTMRNGLVAVLTWQMPNTTMSAYYYTASDYSDRVTAEHVKVMMINLVGLLKTDPTWADFRAMPGYNDDWGITYLITRPLEYLPAPVAADNIQ